MMQDIFSWGRLWAVMVKEFIQMKRDKPTLAMMIITPLMQLTLFGYAINSNPKDLPAALVTSDHSIMTTHIVKSLENTEYFKFLDSQMDAEEADDLLTRGKVQFVVTVPPNFSRDIVRGDVPELLVEVDASDPSATNNAIAAITAVAQTALLPDLQGALNYLLPNPPPFDLRIHAKYNPLALTPYNIVPGLLGVVLTMTMVVITSLAMTRERERGTLENLLATPVRPLEVMIGKIVPYITVGYIQVILILLAARFIFHIPIEGSILLLLMVCFPFIAANLSIGLTFSTLASNQLQAMQSAMFFFLPSILLSGFLFPYQGMPQWAQWLGKILPLTYFLKIVRGILLKGNDFWDIWTYFWPILVIMVIVTWIGMKRFRQTLD